MAAVWSEPGLEERFQWQKRFSEGQCRTHKESNEIEVNSDTHEAQYEYDNEN